MKIEPAYDYRNRVYSAELGRFLQTDPIRFEASDGNLYRYVGNDAICKIDPDGKILVPAVAAVAAYSLWGAVCGHFATTKALQSCPGDKEAHCYTACWFNRCMALTSTHVTIVGAFTWEVVFGWGGDSWADIRAGIKGIIASFSFSDCASACCCKK